MDAKKLRLKSDGYFTEYDINKDPSVANSVAAAALHFSVSLMPANMKLYNAVSNISFPTEYLVRI